MQFVMLLPRSEYRNGTRSALLSNRIPIFIQDSAVLPSVNQIDSNGVVLDLLEYFAPRRTGRLHPRLTFVPLLRHSFDSTACRHGRVELLDKGLAMSNFLENRLPTMPNSKRAEALSARRFRMQVHLQALPLAHLWSSL